MMIIETERLRLRNFQETEFDRTALLAIMSDQEVNRFLPWYPLKSETEARAFFHQHILTRCKQKTGFYLAVCLKTDNRPIGYLTFNSDESHDFGYGLAKEYWNQGIVTEAGAQVTDYLKQLGWSYITATHDVQNPASGKVMEKLGMNYQYSYQEQWQPKNILVTFRMYQLNFDSHQFRIYKGYWDNYPGHFIEAF